MNRLKLPILAALLTSVVVGAALGTGVILAAPTVLQTFAGNRRLFVYSVKFVCNFGPPQSANLIGLVNGTYQTDINIHNPSFSKDNATVLKKFTLAQPEPAQPAGQVQPPFVPAFPPQPYVTKLVILGPDAAMRVDCKEIFALLQPFLCPPAANGCLVTAFKGFVEIISNRSNLDVVAEYSAESYTSIGVSTGISLDVVRVSPQPFTP